MRGCGLLRAGPSGKPPHLLPLPPRRPEKKQHQQSLLRNKFCKVLEGKGKAIFNISAKAVSGCVAWLAGKVGFRKEEARERQNYLLKGATKGELLARSLARSASFTSRLGPEGIVIIITAVADRGRKADGERRRAERDVTLPAFAFVPRCCNPTSLMMGDHKRLRSLAPSRLALDTRSARHRPTGWIARITSPIHSQK